MRRHTLYIIIVLLAIGILGCNTILHKEDDEVIIVTTTNILRSLVESIAPENHKVISLMGAGVDPHSYKASQGDLSKLINADLIFYQGLYLEGKMISVLEKINLQVPSYEVSAVISKDLLIKDDDFHEAVDPHIWFSIPLWRDCAQYVSKILIEQFPEEKENILINTQKYLEELDTLYDWATKQFEMIPANHRVLISAHDAFSYLGRDFNLDVHSLQGISTLSDFGLKSLKEIGDVIIKNQVPAIFLESSVSDRSINALIAGVQKKGYPIKSGGILYSDSLGPKGGDADNYFKMYRHNVNTIAKALNN